MPSPPPPDSSASKPVRNVLVLDDDPTIRLLIGKVVERVGALPHEAATTAEAHAMAGNTRFACALIDKNLGKEDGLEFLRWLRANQPDCDAVVMTAYGNVESTIEALRLGASDFLQKPFELDAITHRLRLLLERQQLISEREAMRAQIVQADRLSTLGTLAAGVVHEINNPLTYVRGGLDYLPDCVRGLRAAARAGGRELEPLLVEIEDVIENVSHGAHQMAAVVSHIKSFAHHAVESPTRVNLQTMLEGTLRMSTVLIRQRASLVRDFAPAPDVEAVESQLAQVFLNLIVNAVHAIPEGAAAKNELKVSLREGAGGEGVIEVSDTGTGMPPEIVARLFEPFFTTKPRGSGTGIGLTICRNIITALSGRIEVESTVGKGTTFRVTLPPIAGGAAAVRPSPPDLPAGRRGRLLIVDDDESITAMLTRTLSREHDVTTENSGRLALARLSLGERFDVILCDLMMPEVTGAQLYAEVERAHAIHAPRMLFVTAGVLSPEANDFAVRIGERLILKPFDMPELKRRLATMIGDLPPA